MTHENISKRYFLSWKEKIKGIIIELRKRNKFRELNYGKGKDKRKGNEMGKMM